MISRIFVVFPRLIVLSDGVIQVVTDGRGNPAATRYDLMGRPVSVTDAAGHTTATTYDWHTGQPVHITDPLGNTTRYKYDIYGRKTAEYGTAITS